MKEPLNSFVVEGDVTHVVIYDKSMTHLTLVRAAVHRLAQCDINTGAVIVRNMLRVTPPSTNSRKREWP